MSTLMEQRAYVTNLLRLTRRIAGSNYWARLLVLLFWLPTISFLSAQAEQLPVKTYTIAEGLARDYINRIKQDSHGYIWFCTTEGISRFDGYEFTNYGVANGLPHRIVNDILETRDGAYLFATSGGLVQFDPAAANSEGSHFTIIPLDQTELSKYAIRLTEDEAGTIWCGTANGTYGLTRAANGWQSAPIGLRTREGDGDPGPPVNTLAFDTKGSLWIGTPGRGLYRLWPDGNVEHYTVQNGLSQNGISDLLLDHAGRMWVGTGTGLTLLVRDPRPNEHIAERVYTTKDGLSNNFIESLYQSSDRRLWIGTRGGLCLLVEPRENNGLSFRSYTTANGLRNVRILSITEDRDRNLWLGAESGGAMKMPLIGFTSYFETDGLGNGRINQLFSDHEGKVYVLANRTEDSAPVIARFDGHGFVRAQLDLPPKAEFSWGWNHLIVQGRRGDWWFATAQGIYHFSGSKTFDQLAHTPPTKFYTDRDGIEGGVEIFCLFEDSPGDIWFSTLGNEERTLHRLDRRTDKIQVYTPERDGIPRGASTAFLNDDAGNLWLGFYSGGISRYRDGHFTVFTEKDGLPAGTIRCLYLDSKKRIWIGTVSGLCRVDNPLTDRPQFTTYTTRNGLTSNLVTTVTEDRWGQIYLGTGRGIDRLDPDSGKIKQFTTADGLADNFINVAMRDSQGALWFGTYRGLSRFIPEQDKPLSPPQAIISGLRVAGVKQTISELGQIDVTVPELSYRQNQLQIDFLSIGYAPGDILRYQFKFEGSASDWSAPTEQRTLTLPNLSPGSYRILVRAINSDGTASSQPASVTFKILPPIWLRWWFIGLASVLAAAVALAIIRQRTARRRERERARDALRQAKEERLRELEQVRSRIAADLHDDIGSNLTRISLISEVAQRKLDGADPPVREQLSSIGKLSRELVDSMSEIVWAINPNKDHLGDLSQKMRHFASDLLTSRQVDFRFPALDFDRDIKVGANVRREFFLIFKEGVNNIARHSACTHVDIELHADHDNLVLTLCDNGKGFDADAKAIGHGLVSMRERTRSLGGQFEINSTLGRGTTLRLAIPLHRDGEQESTDPA